MLLPHFVLWKKGLGDPGCIIRPFFEVVRLRVNGTVLIATFDQVKLQ